MHALHARERSTNQPRFFYFERMLRTRCATRADLRVGRKREIARGNAAVAKNRKFSLLRYEIDNRDSKNRERNDMCLSISGISI